jgi:hypothetical protein
VSADGQLTQDELDPDDPRFACMRDDTCTGMVERYEDGTVITHEVPED